MCACVRVSVLFPRLLLSEEGFNYAEAQGIHRQFWY